MKSTLPYNDASEIEKAKSLFQADKMYILLSVTTTDMINGLGLPYIGEAKKGDAFIYIFTTEEKAKVFVEENKYTILDGIYPIGVMNRNDTYSSMQNTLSIAFCLGVKYAILNGEDCVAIEWLFRANNILKLDYSLLLQVKEERLIKEGKLKKNNIPLRFNPIKHSTFSNRFALTQERKKEICNDMFPLTPATDEQLTDTFTNKQTLHENCMSLTYLSFEYMNKASGKGDEEKTEYYKKVRAILSTVIWKKLEHTENLFVIYDKTGKPHIHSEGIQIEYTDRYKYQNQMEHRPIGGRDEIKKLMTEYSLKNIMVTDGALAAAIIDTEACEDNTL